MVRTVPEAQKLKAIAGLFIAGSMAGSLKRRSDLLQMDPDQ
jgi:hypothetical protein